MKLGQNIGFIDISDEFENGPDRWKNMAARGRGSFLYMYIVKTCEQSRRHIFCPIFMTFGQNIFFLDTTVELKNGWIHLVTWPPGEGGGEVIFLKFID